MANFAVGVFVAGGFFEVFEDVGSGECVCAEKDQRERKNQPPHVVVLPNSSAFDFDRCDLKISSLLDQFMDVISRSDFPFCEILKFLLSNAAEAASRSDFWLMSQVISMFEAILRWIGDWN